MNNSKKLYLLNLLIVFLELIFINNSVLSAVCELDTNRKDVPLVITDGKSEFLYPEDGETTIKLNAGASFELVCPGQKVNVGSSYYQNTTVASCVSESTVQIDHVSVKFDTISCSAAAYRIAKLSGNKCENSGVEVEVGFEVTASEPFLTSFTLCFNENTQQALYSQVTIPASINQRVNGVARPTWLQSTDIFSIKSPDSYYVRGSQRSTINDLLGLSENSTEYIQDNTDYYLSRGHMTAKTDMFYPAQQNVTFFLLNVAPQWQTCNGGNWETIEIDVKDYAEANDVNLTQYTGVYGVTTLPHSTTGKAVELFLYNVDGEKALPVPELYWKAVYEPISQKALVIIVVNNPYLEKYEPICNDISTTITWLNWDKENQKKGFGYACAVDTFRKVVDFLPKFTVTGILE